MIWPAKATTAQLVFVFHTATISRVPKTLFTAKPETPLAHAQIGSEMLWEDFARGHQSQCSQFWACYRKYHGGVKTERSWRIEFASKLSWNLFTDCSRHTNGLRLQTWRDRAAAEVVT
jgi:hypothetical protein